MSPRTVTAAFAACLFALIVAAKWAVFDRFGSPMPDWDQWDAEGGELLIPWHGSDRFLSHLFHPHNEHRVVLTKLQNLTLCVLNGQWDARLEAVANAMLHALLAVALWIAGRRWLAVCWQVPWFVLLVPLFALPVAWQNVLGGFHSQQYWLVCLSVPAVGLLPFARAFSRAWWLGALAAVLALGSMGSGLLAGIAALIVVGWRGWRREIGLREAAPTLAVGFAVVAIGVVARVDVEWHRHMQVKTVRDFVLSIVHSLQWPWRDRPWAAGLFWLPWAWAVWRVVAPATARDQPVADGSARGRAGAIIGALGGWVLLQIAATAYARGAGADYPASRYMDTLACGAAINGLALGWLLMSPPGRRAGRLGLHALGLAWVIALGWGLFYQVGGTFEWELPDAKKYYVKAEGHMRRYLATGDPKHLAHPDIPYPSAQGLIDRLAEPPLRAMMPVPLRPPLPLVPDSPPSTPFVLNDARPADPASASRLGLSPATPPLDFAPSWGSYGGNPGGVSSRGAWQSKPLPPPPAFSWLRFETAGHTGEPGVALELRSADGTRLLANVKPTRTPGDSWRAAYVPSPRVPYIIAARDDDPARWLAFSGPIEMGPLSYWAWQATRHSRLILYGSLATTAALGLLVLQRERSRRRASG